ncbi:DNA methyltransferase [Devosia sp. XK-2]|uniref:class I SAM-dependent DNA methyltransferase n=1 Tax=Devosia sp. XK-2 TaxID=3126689 RepID=UPI0030D5E6EA
MSSPVEQFIARWQGQTGGAERANYALFLTELCAVLDVAPPQPASAEHQHNDYVFERVVSFREAGDKVGHGRIDLYKRGHFVLEAKQSRQKGGPKTPDLAFDPPPPQINVLKQGVRSADRNWDILMLNARRQAEDYARALPENHEWPPFILVCDVGHAFEIFADFTGKGRNYTQFPDRQGFRIYLEDLRRDDIRERLRLIWTDPAALDPTKKAARATREVAGRLANVTRLLEGRGLDPELVAHFLMRCLFTMFAEDVELLPKGSFHGVLQKCADDPQKFKPMVSQLWEAMNTGAFAFAIEAQVKRFNGEFFRNPVVLDLEKEEIGELLMAAGKEWRDVEPAIFGSLLEGALNPKERSKLGAHYTPRAYVERLVIPTILEPLRADWRDAAVSAEKLMAEGKRNEAIQTITDFHDQLCLTRVLDPACGTGNFLYVAMELIKQLEDEVIDALVSMGGQASLALAGHTVDPHQFLGIEVNPRAAAIAELVLWIGYLQIHYRATSEHPAEPILRAFHNIECRDAVLTWDGYPLPKVVDGKETYPNPRKPDWPMADFIVGNPPFLGKGEPMRTAFGDAYLAALWAAHPKMNKSADFVMFWWDHAATLLTAKNTILRRFGLVTTNSITQVFNRRVVERHLGAQKPISIGYAIGDHPWTKASRDAAAVRIAMTMALAGTSEGKLLEVQAESGLDTDTPDIRLGEKSGSINADLTIGADLTAVHALAANNGMACNGMMLAGQGFVLDKATAEHLVATDGHPAGKYIKPFVNGGELVRGGRGRYVIDFFGSEPERLRLEVPATYQYVLETVKPERDANRDRAFRERWWLFGRQRPEIRAFRAGIRRFIGTTETAKHRLFQFLEASTTPDHMVVAIGSDDAFHLGALSSRIHVTWALRAGGWLGVGNDPRYSKSRCFDPFPFPDPDGVQKAEIARLAEALDAHRKRVQAEHPDITLTEMYNVLEKLKADVGPSSPRPSGERVPEGRVRGEGPSAPAPALTPREDDVKSRALVLILRELHEELDAAVLAAYGWPQGLSDDDLLTRLVALNKARAAEEAAGHVRWLRPDYQRPRFGTPAQKAEKGQLDLVAPADKGKPAFPTDERRRTAAIFAILASATGPVSPADIAARFRKGKSVEKEIALTLHAFVRFGDLASLDGGKTFQLRQVA